jgi:hypothetical protein
MEQSMVNAMQYMQAIRDKRLEEHREKHSKDKQCSGLTENEWFKVKIRQKSTFSKSRKFAHTRLWNYKNVTL